MRGRTRSRARHADTQDGVGAEFTLVLNHPLLAAGSQFPSSPWRRRASL